LERFNNRESNENIRYGPVSAGPGVDYATTQSQYYVWNNKLIYGRQTGQYMTVNGLSELAQNIYLYDFATGTENKLAQDQTMPYFPKCLEIN